MKGKKVTIPAPAAPPAIAPGVPAPDVPAALLAA